MSISETVLIEAEEVRKLVIPLTITRSERVNTNSKTYGTLMFNAAFTRTLQ